MMLRGIRDVCADLPLTICLNLESALAPGARLLLKRKTAFRFDLFLLQLRREPHKRSLIYSPPLNKTGLDPDRYLNE